MNFFTTVKNYILDFFISVGTAITPYPEKHLEIVEHVPTLEVATPSVTDTIDETVIPDVAIPVDIPKPILLPETEIVPKLKPTRRRKPKKKD